MIKISYKDNVSDKTFAKVLLNEGFDTEVFKSSSGEKSISIGIGRRREVTLRKLHLLPRRIVSLARANKIKKLAVSVSDLLFDCIPNEEDLGRVLAIGFEMANFEFTKFKTEPKDGWNFVVEVAFVGKVSKNFKDGFREGQIIADEVNKTRELANTPGGEMTPRHLAEAAKIGARGTGVGVTVLGKSQMKKLGMGAILGVASGSSEEPQFIVAEYRGGNSKERPIILVGKGITFDTGGLNLKPAEGMYEMHMDMSGGAAVLHTVFAVAKLGLKKNVVAIVPAVENMPSGSSYRPGDVLRSMSGKTIEILNTDAEGRVILADGLYYAGKNYNPRLVVDVATLTGAAMVALGQRASAIFTKDQDLENKLRDLGEKTGDFVWPMPLWDEYEDEIKGTFGDWANLGKYQRMGGAIAGAIFLYQFTKDYPKDTKWVHIDMAPRMTAIEGDFLAKGAIGTPVRLLVDLIRDY